MNTHLLFGLLFLMLLNCVAQEPTMSPAIKKNKSARIQSSHLTTTTAPINSNAEIITEHREPLLISSSSGSWTIIGGSRNIFGVIESESQPLQYHPGLNAISFIHTCSDSYSASPANNAGAIVANISTDMGNSWDSTCIWSNTNYSGAFPQGGIYNPPGNTNINSAYIVGAGPAVNTSSNYTGGWFASKQLGTANYNYTASPVTGAMQLLGNSPITNTAVGKSDFPAFGFTSTDDGKVRTLGKLCKNVNLSSKAAVAYRGLSIVKGTFNSGVFNWTSDSLLFDPVIHTYASGSVSSQYKMVIGNPVMAWNSAGTVGYAITVGVRAAPSNSQSMGYQPIVWVTTNSGATWATVPGINFASPTFSWIVKRLQPTETDTTLVIPQFNTSEGISATVDANNKLHFLSTIISTRSSLALDSMDASYVYTMSVNTPTNTYKWPHMPGKRPYIYDFITDGLTWFYKRIDSMSTEAPGGLPGEGGYDENPIAANGAGVKPVSDARLQLSRTPDGKFVFYSWAESDTNFISIGLKYNIIPDIKVRRMDVIGTPTTTPGGNGPYDVNSQKINLSAIGNPPQIQGKSVMHYMSPTASSMTLSMIGAVTNGSATIPFTVTHSDAGWPPSVPPFASLSGNAHYFNAVKLNYYTYEGIKENLGSVSSSYLYPNPASHSAILSIDMKDNAVVNVDVYNTIGQLVKSSKNTAQIGENNFNIDLSNLSSGIYLVNVKVGNATSTKKLIVE